MASLPVWVDLTREVMGLASGTEEGVVTIRGGELVNTRPHEPQNSKWSGNSLLQCEQCFIYVSLVPW